MSCGCRYRSEDDYDSTACKYPALVEAASKGFEALLELRNVSADLCRLIVQHGLTDELPEGRDGFGVRADTALHALHAVLPPYTERLPATAECRCRHVFRPRGKSWMDKDSCPLHKPATADAGEGKD